METNRARRPWARFLLMDHPLFFLMGQIGSVVRDTLLWASFPSFGARDAGEEGPGLPSERLGKKK